MSDEARDRANELLEKSAEFHNRLAAELFKNFPRAQVVLTCRMIAVLGEATLERRDDPAWAEYQIARALFMSTANEHLERAGLLQINHDGLTLKRTTDPGDKLAPAPMAALASELSHELQQIIIGAGYCMDVGLLACAALVHMGEAVLKHDKNGVGDSEKRWARYQLALAEILKSASDGLTAEDVPTAGGAS